jgi:hypothetical protein
MSRCPSVIGELDLVRAVAGGAGRGVDEQPLDERINTLRACVENWPESLYRWHGPDQRQQLDTVFRHLAFKDPNTACIRSSGWTSTPARGCWAPVSRANN